MCQSPLTLVAVTCLFPLPDTQLYSVYPQLLSLVSLRLSSPLCATLPPCLLHCSIFSQSSQACGCLSVEADSPVIWFSCLPPSCTVTAFWLQLTFRYLSVPEQGWVSSEQTNKTTTKTTFFAQFNEQVSSYFIYLLIYFFKYLLRTYRHVYLQPLPSEICLWKKKKMAICILFW